MSLLIPASALRNVRTASCGYGYSISLSGIHVLQADDTETAPSLSGIGSHIPYLVAVSYPRLSPCVFYVSGIALLEYRYAWQNPLQHIGRRYRRKPVAINAGCLIANT